MGIKRGKTSIENIPKLLKIYSGKSLVWMKSLNFTKISDGYFKVATEPGANYRVILNGYDSFDIGTRQYGTDIRNSTVRSNEIVFTAKSKETFFRIYGSNIKIISILKIKAGG